MRIETVWAVRKYSPDEPELVVAWDEDSVDSNPEGFQADVDRALASLGSDLLETRRIVLHANYLAISDAFKATEIPVDVDG